MPEINHTFRNGLIICPYCRKEEEDLKFRDNKLLEGEKTCSFCNKKFEFKAEIIIWSTKKIDGDYIK